MPDFVYPLVAIRDDGTTITATSQEEAAAFNRLRPGRQHVHGHMWISAIGPSGPIWREHITRHEWIVRDDHGATVLHEDLPDTDAPRMGWLRRQLRDAQDAAARGLPIPGTGRRRRYSAGYRSYRTDLAMRAAESALADDLRDWGLEGMNVGRIRAPELPQVWDDVPWRSRRRCWKDYRATQWRKVERPE